MEHIFCWTKVEVLMTRIILQIYDGDDYEEEEPLRPMRDPIDDYYRDADDDEQPIATSTERQRQVIKVY